MAELEYPNSGASERFILLIPRDHEHYNPLICLESSLHAMVKRKQPIRRVQIKCLHASSSQTTSLPLNKCCLVPFRVKTW